MATITLIIIIFWWNPQKLITYFLKGDPQNTHQIQHEKKAENVD